MGIRQTQILEGAVNYPQLATGEHSPFTYTVAADGTGDYTDIQDAIDALPSGGGFIYIKEGTYNITSTILIEKNNVALLGAGKATKISTSSNITMIQVNGSYEGILLERLYIYGAGGGSSNTGINFGAASESSIKNCWIDNCGYDGFFSENALNNVIFGNFINNPISWGIHLKSVSGGNLVQNNIISNPGQYGIGLYPSSFNVLSGNTVSSAGVSGIITYQSKRNIITGNHLLQNAKNGVYLQGSDNSLVSNNISYDNNYDGIYIYDGSDDNVVTGNRCKDNSRYEINIASGCTNNLVVGNQCVGTHVGGIYDAGTNTQVFSNAE